jgi:DNA-binding transcriptional MocR family regulator
VKATQDLGSAVLSQVVAERLLQDVDRIRGWRRDDLRARYEVLAGALRAALPAWSWQEPGGGLSIWVRLPVADAAPFAQVALRHGVAVATSSPLSVGDRHRDHLRLSFALPPEELVAGVGRLAAASAEVLHR